MPKIARTAQAIRSLIALGEIEMAGLTAKILASRQRETIRAEVAAVAANLTIDAYFDAPDLRHATACVLVAERHGWTREEVESLAIDDVWHARLTELGREWIHEYGR